MLSSEVIYPEGFNMSGSPFGYVHETALSDEMARYLISKLVTGQDVSTGESAYAIETLVLERQQLIEIIAEKDQAMYSAWEEAKGENL